jgi:hypothetical protein
MEWLHRPEYAIYAGPQSDNCLVNLVELITWALEKSLPANQWRYFLSELKGCLHILRDTPDPDGPAYDEHYRYEAARALLLHILEKYKAHISVSIKHDHK